MKTPPQGRLLVGRVANGAATGLGHLVRTAALCDSWCEQGGRAVLFVDQLEPMLASLVGRVELLAASDGDAGEQLRAMGLGDTPHVVVFDGYRFDDRCVNAFVAEVMDGGNRPIIVSIDDHDRAGRRRVDVAIDPNVGARRADTSAPVSLHGPSFALLRPEFSAAAREGSDDERVGPLVIALGGSTASNGSTALAHLGTVMAESMLLMGHRPPELADVPRLDPAESPVGALADAPVAIAAAGGTALELACLGTPAVLVSIADNQVPVTRALGEAGAAVDLGRLADLDGTRLVSAVVDLLGDRDRRAAMSKAGRALVDGRGVRRCLAYIDAASLATRPVDLDDAAMLLTWRNDPTTRSSSFDSDVIDLEQHLTWLDRRLHDPDSFLYIGRRGDDDIGHVRFQQTDERHAVIGVVISPQARGQRLASPLILAGLRAFLAESSVTTVEALIKVDNVSSLAAFTLAGFHPGPNDDDQDPAVKVLHYERTDRWV